MSSFTIKGNKDVNFVRAIYEVITVDFLLTNKMIKKDLEKKKVYKTRYTKSFVFKTCFTEFFYLYYIRNRHHFAVDWFIIFIKIILIRVNFILLIRKKIE